MLRLTRQISPQSEIVVDFTLALTAEERMRSRHYFETAERQPIYLDLPRGTVLQDGDLLQTEVGDRTIRITAKPEPVMTITAHTHLELLRAAYHLGNRHVPLEVHSTYLRLSPDLVLQDMLEQMGLHVQEEIQPFQPEGGAYRHNSAHSHAGTEDHSHPHAHQDSHAQEQL